MSREIKSFTLGLCPCFSNPSSNSTHLKPESGKSPSIDFSRIHKEGNRLCQWVVSKLMKLSCLQLGFKRDDFLLLLSKVRMKPYKQGSSKLLLRSNLFPCRQSPTYTDARWPASHLWQPVLCVAKLSPYFRVPVTPRLIQGVCCEALIHVQVSLVI
jgi:hypothetical protein